MENNDKTRTELKAVLLGRVQALSSQQALFPSEKGPIDALVQQLEGLNPTPDPLHPEALPALLGNWQLVYASGGTVVTRPIASFSQSLLAGITIDRIWQQLTLAEAGALAVENGAELEVPLLGRWQLQAEGIWVWEPDPQVARVSFKAFSVEAVHPLGLKNGRLPPLRIPVLEALRNQATWRTSYLDPELRVGRGATGNLFVFVKDLER